MTIIYTKTGCPWCVEMIKFFVSRDISFEQRNVNINPEYFQEMIERSGQTKAPTLVFDNGDILADTDAAQVEIYLKKHNML